MLVGASARVARVGLRVLVQQKLTMFEKAVHARTGVRTLCGPWRGASNRKLQV